MGEKDPVKNYERFLLEGKVLNEPGIVGIRNEFKNEIEAELKLDMKLHR